MTFQTSREIAAHPADVFAAFKDPARLAAWWGPAGFTNTFEACEFAPGGKWSYVMHGPGGKRYPNESVFRDIEPSKRVVIHHVSQPRYLLTVTLEPTGGGGTLVRWVQEFEDSRVADGIGHIVVPANEQNLDRLSQEALRLRVRSVLTCPECGKSSEEEMPLDACIYFHECPGCGALLKPNRGDCCVFCSFGSVKCPPVQEAGGCCGARPSGA